VTSVLAMAFIAEAPSGEAPVREGMSPAFVSLPPRPEDRPKTAPRRARVWVEVK